MTEIIIAGALIAGVGIFIGVFLGVAGEKFEVEVDPRETQILDVLPGNNCGGCGYPGCSGLAAAIVKGEAPVNQCPVGGAPVGAKIGEIMGVAAEEGVRKVAFVKCIGTCDKAKNDYEYIGLKDCSMAKRVPGGGPKSCNYGCLGFGSCVKACPFDAIHVINGVATVNPEACKACGKCIAACPNGLIEFVPYNATQIVQCSNKDMGKQVMQVCQAGCIACHLCEKNCPSEAITVENNIAHIDQEKCTHCGTCAEKCPKKVILTK
ncbi:electron transport complex, RnfABCDGE type, B subunit [Lachnospiraceae bacterium XBB1006]|nr:electron transport complex, RnfABCDGE type, B subunit [Lachnospiraceae bacterium XBB1006]